MEGSGWFAVHLDSSKHLLIPKSINLASLNSKENSVSIPAEIRAITTLSSKNGIPLSEDSKTTEIEKLTGLQHPLEIYCS